MDERSFFDRLERLVCAGLGELEGDDRPCLWCDGLIVSLELLVEDPPRLEGAAWMGGIAGQPRGTQEEWWFVLLPDPAAIEGGRVDWRKLAEAGEGEGWLRVDAEAKSLEINLRADRGEADGDEA